MFIITIIFPLLLIVVLGYGAARTRLIPSPQLQGLNRFIFYLCIPALLFSNMLQAELDKALDIKIWISFYTPVICLYFLVFLVYRKKQKATLADSAVFSLGSVYSNTILVGLPVIISALGQTYAPLVFMIIVFHSALLFFFTFLLAEKGNDAQTNWPGFLRNVLVNPIVASISLGLMFNLMQIEFYAPVLKSLELLAQPALPGALFILGANLFLYSMSDKWGQSLSICAIKLLLLPGAVVGLAGSVFSLKPEIVLVLALLSASPLGINAYLVANQIKAQQSLLAGSVVLTTLLSPLSYIFWLSVLWRS